MRRRKASVWVFAVLSLGFLLFSGSLAFASFPIGWMFQISQNIPPAPKIGPLPEFSLPQVVQKNRSIEESYFFEYEVWRRIHSSA